MGPNKNRSRPPANAHWRIEDIAFHEIDRSELDGDERLFYMVASASFIEMAADVYSGNLVEHYQDNPEAVEWLSGKWRHEEVQHGVALREYVKRAWPEFDWNSAYQGFFHDYSAACTKEELETSAALELAARCVVEMGTSTYYTMLSNYASEPVLKQLADRIKRDEVSHYRGFRRIFEVYNGQERPGRLRLIRTLIKRFAEAESDDAYYAFKHVYRLRHPDCAFRREDFEGFMSELNPIMQRHYPYKMAVRMLLAMLDLNALVRRFTEPFLIAAARRLMFR